MALIIIFSFHNSFRNSINCTLNPANIRFDEEVLKTSWRRLEDVFRLRLQYVLIKTNIFALIIHLQKISSRRLDQDQYFRRCHASSRHLQGVLQKRLQDVFKTFWRRLLEVLKTSSRRLANVFSRRIIRSRICIGHTSEKFMVTFSHNSMVVFHFTISV